MVTRMYEYHSVDIDERSVSIVIPAHNEATRIEKTITAILEVFSQSVHPIEIIVVDDGSTDTTRNVLQTIVQKWPDVVRVITLAHNHGKGYAIKTGFAHSHGDAVGFIDADLEYPADALPIMVEMVLESGQACAIASRVADNRPVWERWSSKLAHQAAATVLELPVRDTQAGIKMFPGPFARTTLSHCQQSGWLYDIEALLHAVDQEFEIIEVPVMQKSVRRRRASLWTMATCLPTLLTLAAKHRRTLRQQAQHEARQATRFGLVGIVNSLVDLASYWGLVQLWSPGHNGYQAGFESMMAWGVASLVGYALHSRYTFGRRLPRTGFYLVTGTGVAVQVVTTGLMTALGGPHLAVIGKLVGIFLASIVTYSGYRWIAHSSPDLQEKSRARNIQVRQADIPVVQS
ncbi:MAG: glycosyl transferase family 2 [Sulfobacillus acidophilus]|uniref:Glycosyl transferase family 2 n=1 Tax=Sulfobacillus acidophilus TaxID=53633 RepID=A0A2T2WCX7_9FIRM|nr:MAG: glycosyl transferase family 2 [Sulfobacillus acidophilus]